MEMIKEGAEARLYKKKIGSRIVLVKDRVRKEYRNEKLDEEVRKQRTRREEKLIRTVERIGVRVPSIIEVKEHEIIMEFIEGKTLKQALNEKNTELCLEIGKNIAKLHSNSIVHGDLTTSNMILCGKEIVFIDFGLGFTSNKVEDKAVDLLNLKKTFEATHSSFFEKGWEKIIEGYLKEGGKKEVISQIEKIEKRARYKT